MEKPLTEFLLENLQTRYFKRTLPLNFSWKFCEISQNSYSTGMQPLLISNRYAASSDKEPVESGIVNLKTSLMVKDCNFNWF